MKKNCFILSIILMILLFTACSQKKSTADVLIKDFYNEYFKAIDNDRSKVDAVKEKYMTKLLIEELNLRTMQMDADSISGVQDSTGMLDKMVITKNDNENEANATFTFENDGEIYEVIDVNVGFIDIDGKKLMNTFDMHIINFDGNGNDTTKEYITKYANKDELTEKDRTEMESIKEKYENLFSEGYIG